MHHQAGTNGKVEATAGKHCQFDVPFSVQVSFCFSCHIRIFLAHVLASVFHHPNDSGEEAVGAYSEDPRERWEGVEGGPGHQCDDARRQDQRQRDQPQAWQVRHIQGNLKQIVGSSTVIQVVVGNNQGECSTDVDVNIMDKPPEVGF